MRLKEKIDQDLEQAMLAGDKTLAETLRGIKSAILNAEIAAGKRDSGLSEDEMIQVLGKEAKKRQESADLYAQGGNTDRQQAELEEKKVIGKYLPEQLSEDDLNKIIDEVALQTGGLNQQNMGQAIGQVKQKAGASADGAMIAMLIKQRISQ